MRSALAVLIAVVGCSTLACHAAEGPPPGAIKGWFDPATGRFEPLDQAVPAPTVSTTAAAAAEPFVRGTYVLPLTYGPLPGVKPDDTLECRTNVTVSWQEGPSGGPKWPVSQSFDDYVNAAWKDRPSIRRLSIILPARQTSSDPPVITRRIACVINDAEIVPKAFVDLQTQLSGTRKTFGPNLRDPVTLTWR